MRSPRRLVVFASAGLLVIAGLGGLYAAAPPSAQELEESLTCQCGCGLTVHGCNHLQCDSAIPLRAEVRAQLSEGKDKKSILDYFMNKYGEKILSAPTTSGFNLTAWVMPFGLLTLGGVFVITVLIRWSGRQPSKLPASGTTDQAPHTPSVYENILERELKDFDR